MYKKEQSRIPARLLDEMIWEPILFNFCSKSVVELAVLLGWGHKESHPKTRFCHCFCMMIFILSKIAVACLLSNPTRSAKRRTSARSGSGLSLTEVV